MVGQTDGHMRRGARRYHLITRDSRNRRHDTMTDEADNKAGKPEKPTPRRAGRQIEVADA